MQRLRVILVCHTCGFLELRYVVPLPPLAFNVLSFQLPVGWHQQWHAATAGFVLVCDRCVGGNSP
jgi:hypothetical protein